MILVVSLSTDPLCFDKLLLCSNAGCCILTLWSGVLQLAIWLVGLVEGGIGSGSGCPIEYFGSIDMEGCLLMLLLGESGIVVGILADLVPTQQFQQNWTSFGCVAFLGNWSAFLVLLGVVGAPHTANALAGAGCLASFVLCAEFVDNCMLKGA